MARKNIGFESQSSGTTINAGNSGGGSDDALSLVGTSGTPTLVFDSSVAANGAQSLHVVGDTASVVSLGYAGYTDSSGALRFKFRLNSLPTATLFIGRILANADASRSAQVGVNSAAHLIVADAAAATKATFTGVTLTVGPWYRVELESIVGASTTTGTINCRLYADNDPEGSPLATYASGAAVNSGTTTVSGFRVGQLVAGTACDVNFDSYAIDNGTSTPIGPVVTAVSPTGLASAEAFGTLSVAPGAVTVSPSGIASAEAIGVPAVTAGPVSVMPSGMASAQAFGVAVVAPGGVTVSPSGIASGETSGSPTATPGPVTVSPSGIASGEGVGSPSVTVVHVGPLVLPPDRTLTVAAEMRVCAVPAESRTFVVPVESRVLEVV